MLLHCNKRWNPWENKVRKSRVSSSVTFLIAVSDPDMDTGFYAL